MTATGLTIIVTGGRMLLNRELFNVSMDSAIFQAASVRKDISRHEPLRLRVAHGCCPTGADMIARDWVKGQGPNVVEARHPPDWDLHGKAAGPIRNSEMVAAERDVADLCLAFWDGKSTGTKDCFIKAIQAGIKTIVIPFGDFG